MVRSWERACLLAKDGWYVIFRGVWRRGIGSRRLGMIETAVVSPDRKLQLQDISPYPQCPCFKTVQLLSLEFVLQVLAYMWLCSVMYLGEWMFALHFWMVCSTLSSFPQRWCHCVILDLTMPHCLDNLPSHSMKVQLDCCLKMYPVYTKAVLFSSLSWM